MPSVSTEGWIEAYDAVDWQKMPPTGAHYLYVDGDYAAPAAARQAYPDAYTIAIDPGTEADEYDVESGNPDHPVTWAVMMRARHGYTGRIYCSESSVASVLDQFTTAGLMPPQFRLASWTSEPPGTVPDYGAGTVGVQWASTPGYDTSLIRPDLPHYATPAAPAAPPATEDDEMSTTSNADGKCALSWAAGSRHVIQVVSVPGAALDLLFEFFEVDGDAQTNWNAGTLTLSAQGMLVYEIPAAKIPGCRGVLITQQNGTGAYYAVAAV